MIKIEVVLLAKRSDGKFLALDEQRHTTTYEFVDDPTQAKRIYPHNTDDFKNPQPAHYYFENSYRAREFWTKDCVMVPYEITTEVTAKPFLVVV